ncbi:hypothetical protein ACFQ60_47640 [Streptomyces zhihengii]
MLAQTLCELDEREYYHRDIKPDNLFGTTDAPYSRTSASPTSVKRA